LRTTWRRGEQHYLLYFEIESAQLNQKPVWWESAPAVGLVATVLATNVLLYYYYGISLKMRPKSHFNGSYYVGSTEIKYYENLPQKFREVVFLIILWDPTVVMLLKMGLLSTTKHVEMRPFAYIKRDRYQKEEVLLNTLHEHLKCMHSLTLFKEILAVFCKIGPLVIC